MKKGTEKANNMKRINHMMDIVKEFFVIIEKIEDLKKQIVDKSKINYRSQDARLVALDSIQMNMQETGMWIKALNSLANECMIDEKTFDENKFLKCVGSNLSIKDTEIRMLNNLRLGFMVLVHFKIDNLFQNLLRELNKTLGNTGYWNLCNAILNAASLPEKGGEKDILTILANLRNSLHGNGIHKGSNLNKTINGLNYSFEDGKIVKCASWNHIIEALSANVEVLSKILLSNEIKSINYEIEDKYASAINTI